MDVFAELHLCKLFFSSITFAMVVVGVFINTIEHYLPPLITRSFRYGKFASKEESTLIKKLEVPKSYFRHFYVTSAIIYVIVLYEVLSVYLFGNEVSEWMKFLLDFSCGYKRKTTVSSLQVLIAITLLMLQVFRRLYDTVFVSVFSDQAYMNLSHYFIGLAYYPAIVLMILSEAPKFSNNLTEFVNYRIQFHHVGIMEIFVIVLFLWAWYHQHVATVILANIRKNKEGNVVSQKYEIPQGDWFKYLSSPHSTAEIIIYTALTILLSNNSGWLYVYAWVLANQVETILLSHWWYQSKFKDFPKERKALIPFIY